ncbi:hypothetical protein DXG03_008629, partial [Asterophora parasitica]
MGRTVLVSSKLVEGLIIPTRRLGTYRLRLDQLDSFISEVRSLAGKRIHLRYDTYKATLESSEGKKTAPKRGKRGGVKLREKREKEEQEKGAEIEFLGESVSKKAVAKPGKVVVKGLKISGPAGEEMDRIQEERRVAKAAKAAAKAERAAKAKSNTALETPVEGTA